MFRVFDNVCVVLFSRRVAAEQYADQVNSRNISNRHPFRAIVEVGGHTYWRRPSGVGPDGEWRGAVESPPAECGDRTRAVRAVVVRWYADRDASWAAD